MRYAISARSTVLVAALAAALSGSAASLHAQARGITAFVGVQVVRTDRGDILPDQTVIVQDGRIVRIGPAGSTALPRGAGSIAGVGAYLIPGLFELDGYLPTDDDDNRNEVLLMYVARGVTTVRGVLTDSSQIELERRVNGGNPTGPRIVLSEASGGARRDLRAQLRAPLPSTSDSVSPADVLRALTIEAARTLDLERESGSVAEGARADLVLLAANPLESTTNLTRVVGTMVHGRWVEAEDLHDRMEGRAKGLVEGYYWELPRRGFSIPGCSGETLRECFGGDPDCSRSYNCTAEGIPSKRALLLDEMELLGGVAPQSDWIVGQRVYLAVKNDDVEGALAAAEPCVATLWWCQALRGYARHARSLGSGEAQLDSAFFNAPPGTPAWGLPRYASNGDRGLHCEWTDLSLLLSGGPLAQQQRLGCGFDGRLEKRFWWLSDPLWAIPGNERRSEHIVRNIQMKLHDELMRERGGLDNPLPAAASATCPRFSLTSCRSHAKEHHVEVLAGGVPNSWQTTMMPGRLPSSGGPQMFAVGGGYVNGGYAFTPSDERLHDPVHTMAEDWAVTWNEPRFVRTVLNRPAQTVQLLERMHTRERWLPIEHQTAVLRRDGRLRVMAAARPPVLMSSYDNEWAALAMGRPFDLRIQATSASIGSAGDLRASIDVDPPVPVQESGYLWSEADGEWMASLEVIGEDFRARARQGVPAPPLVDGFGLSDLVLVDDRYEREQLPVLDAMLGTSDLSGRSSVGVYFEVYGIEPDETLEIVVSAEPTDRSLFARVTDAVRLRAAGSLAVRFQESVQLAAPGRAERHVTVNLSSLESGTYELFVTVRRGNGTTASAARVVKVAPPAG